MLAIKRLMKFTTALLMRSCGSSSQMSCRAATVNESIVLGFGWRREGKGKEGKEQEKILRDINYWFTVLSPTDEMF